MSEYTEAIKKRILAGNLDKPDELYPMLVKEIAMQKRSIATYLEAYFSGKQLESIVDIGGAQGDLIKDLKIKNKYVVDKREFNPRHGNIEYRHAIYISSHTEHMDVAIYSEFLHLFPDMEVVKIVTECKARYIVVIENIPDDFLDLRLRLWSNGKCIEPNNISRLLDVEPAIVNEHYVWIKEINHE